MSAWIWGIGTSRFGKQPTVSTAELAWTAVQEALRDAAVDKIDAVYVGSCFGEPGVAQRCLVGLGITGVPVLSYESACASSSVALHEARLAVEGRRYGAVLVLGVEHLTSRFNGPIPVEQRDLEGRSGLALPALYAMSATRYSEQHGLTNRELALVSVKNHRHGAQNPRAAYGAELTVEEVLTSRLVADPLTLLQCCGIADGAAAAIVGSRRRGSRDIRLRTTSFRTGGLWGAGSDHAWGYELTRGTSRAAYEETGIPVTDVDVFEVHDAFTIGEIVTTEAIGLAPEGRGGELVAKGDTWLGGKSPVNPSGGLLARGHPLGATGTAQLGEIVRQLRSEAGHSQVSDARVGMIETLGGGVGGLDGNSCVVGILSSS